MRGERGCVGVNWSGWRRGRTRAHFPSCCHFFFQLFSYTLKLRCVMQEAEVNDLSSAGFRPRHSRQERSWAHWKVLQQQATFSDVVPVCFLLNYEAYVYFRCRGWFTQCFCCYFSFASVFLFFICCALHCFYVCSTCEESISLFVLQSISFVLLGLVSFYFCSLGSLATTPILRDRGATFRDFEFQWPKV